MRSRFKLIPARFKLIPALFALGLSLSAQAPIIIPLGQVLPCTTTPFSNTVVLVTSTPTGPKCYETGLVGFSITQATTNAGGYISIPAPVVPAPTPGTTSVIGETPAGIINGINATFTLLSTN